MNNEYQTSDFPTSIVLLLRRHRLLEVDRSNPRRVVFSFEQTTALERDLDHLAVGKLRVDPMEFWAAERRCKSLIYNSHEL